MYCSRMISIHILIIVIIISVIITGKNNIILDTNPLKLLILSYSLFYAYSLIPTSTLHLPHLLYTSSSPSSLWPAPFHMFTPARCFFFKSNFPWAAKSQRDEIHPRFPTLHSTYCFLPLSTTSYTMLHRQQIIIIMHP